MQRFFRIAPVLFLCLGWLPGAERAAASDSPHGRLAVACESCHTLDGWNELRRPIGFDHDAETGFSLARHHAAISCRGCHESLEFSRVASACADCHENPHQGTLGGDCESCHSTAGWTDRGLLLGRHDATLFALTGSHTRLDCVECHGGTPPLDFAGTPTDCLSCHLTDYQATTSPNHQRAGFSTQCVDCHGTTAWDEARFGGGPDFEHDLFFVLTGAHAAADCGLCHAGGQFAGTPTDCFSCHRQEYQATREPRHAAAGFGTDCESCHATSSWQGAVFDHARFWALEGGHRGLDCLSCHVDGVFAGTPRRCNGCHRDDYNATTDPPHAAAGFPRECESCHGVRSWQGAQLDHDRFFRLTGAHRGADCESCHADGVYAGTPRRCNGCHSADYNRTRDPNHAAAGFPRECESCHNTRGWGGADFDHDRVFALTGAHRRLDCDSCHAGGVFSGTPRACNGCHSEDYDRTRNPNHVAVGFPRSCQSCHSTSRWEGARFNHQQFFPIESGDHRGLDCSDCHVVANNFQVFECIECHEHRRSEMDDEHDDVGGYVWESQACYSCHPDGRE